MPAGDSAGDFALSSHASSHRSRGFQWRAHACSCHACALCRFIASSDGDFWMVSQQMALDFDMVPGVLGGFSAPLFDIGIADLGKRRRPTAFRADFAYKTAQKLSVDYSPSALSTVLTRNAVAPLPHGSS